MIVLGADALRMSVWSEVDPMPEGLATLQIGLVDWDLAKNYAAEMAIRADVRETLRALMPVIEKRAARRCKPVPPNASRHSHPRIGRPNG